MNRYLHQSRAFINPHGYGNNASIVCNVAGGYEDKNKDKACTYEIGVSDCHRKVVIHGNLHNMDDVRVARIKVDKMMTVLVGLKLYLEDLTENDLVPDYEGTPEVEHEPYEK